MALEHRYLLALFALSEIEWCEIVFVSSVAAQNCSLTASFAVPDPGRTVVCGGQVSPDGFNQSIQRIQQFRIVDFGFLAATPRRSDSAAGLLRLAIGEFSHAAPDRGPRRTSGPVAQWPAAPR